MNFQRTNRKISLLEDYYSHFDEDGRLKTRHGYVEFMTNMHYILKYLNDNHDLTILDIGAGTGAYSVYLDKLGYHVTAVELTQHNIEIFKQKESNCKIIQGNALDLSVFADNSFDVVLLFGPMYHLLRKEEQIRALKEAKRVVKPQGKIFISYYMNEYAILTYGFIKKHILESKRNHEIDENYHVVSKEDDLYTMVRLEDIDEFNQILNLKRLQIIASDGASNYIRTTLNSLSQEEYQEYLNYHLQICERKDLLGASAHVLDIVTKN